MFTGHIKKHPEIFREKKNNNGVYQRQLAILIILTITNFK